MARLLNTYQLWLDDLFPKAKFADGLALIEKQGHKKRMQMMRKEWIDESKPKPVQEPDDMDVADEDAEQVSENTRPEPEQTEGAEDGDQAPQQIPDEEPEEDELDALLAESAPAAGGHTSLFGSGSHAQSRTKPPEPDTFADEEELMAGMDW